MNRLLFRWSGQLVHTRRWYPETNSYPADAAVANCQELMNHQWIRPTYGETPWMISSGTVVIFSNAHFESMYVFCWTNFERVSRDDQWNQCKFKIQFYEMLLLICAIYITLISCGGENTPSNTEAPGAEKDNNPTSSLRWYWQSMPVEFVNKSWPPEMTSLCLSRYFYRSAFRCGCSHHTVVISLFQTC